MFFYRQAGHRHIIPDIILGIRVFYTKKQEHLNGTPDVLERMKGIEPSRSAWKAEVLPLNYIRISATIHIIALFYVLVKNFCVKTFDLVLNILTPVFIY